MTTKEMKTSRLSSLRPLIIPRRIALSTGCRSLDRAIALPAEFAAYASPTPLAPTVRQINGTIDKINTHKSNEDDDDDDDQTTGIPFGFITQLTGPPGSGKSQLAQHVALASARLGGTVWYLHSSAQPFLSAASTTTTAPSTTPQVLERIVVAPARDAYSLLLRLAELEGSLQRQEVAPAATTATTGNHDGPPPSATVLIMDSCSVCLAATDDDTLYATVSSTIKRLTREYDLATILTIGTVGADRQSGSGVTGGGHNNNIKAALGQFWSGVADVEVWLEPVPLAPLGTIKATVPRHFAKESSTLVHHFAIRESGIVEVGQER
jgi:energy-coupling factor transporter ATP-binding protein EcfA2